MSENFEDLVNEAEVALQHQDFDEARKRFHAALAAKPYPCAQKSRIHRRLGELAYRANDLPTACLHLEEAEQGYSGHCCSRLDRESHVDTLLLLAHIYRDQGDKQKSADMMHVATWKREMTTLDNWRLANQIFWLVSAAVGVILGCLAFKLTGLAVLSLGGFPLLMICLVAGLVGGAVLAIVVQNFAVGFIVRSRLRQALKRLKLRNPLPVE